MTTDCLVIEWCHKNAPPSETVIDWTQLAVEHNSTSVRIDNLRESTEKFLTFSPIVEKTPFDHSPDLKYVDDALLFVPVSKEPVPQEKYIKTNLKYNFDDDRPIEEKAPKSPIVDIQTPIDESKKTKLVLPESSPKRMKLEIEEKQAPIQVVEDDKMDVQIEEDKMDVQIEEEDKMELEVLPESDSEEQPLDEIVEERHEEPVVSSLPEPEIDWFHYYPLGDDDTPPQPDEYEEQNDVEEPAVRSKPLREKKRVKRYEDEQTPPDSEAEEDENGNKVEKIRKPKRGEKLVLVDVTASTIHTVRKKGDGKPYVDVSLIGAKNVEKIIKEKSKYKFSQLPNFSKFEANAVAETPQFAIWLVVCEKAYNSAFHSILFANTIVTPKRHEMVEKYSKKFTEWCDEVFNICHTNIPNLPCCERDDDAEEKVEQTMPILYLVIQYQEMECRKFSENQIFIMFSHPLVADIPDTRSFKVDFHTYFQLKALHCAIRPFDMLVEIWINVLRKYCETLYQRQQTNPPPKDLCIETRTTEEKQTQYKMPKDIFASISKIPYEAERKTFFFPKAVESFKLWWWYQSIFKCNFAEDIVNASSGENFSTGKPVLPQH